MGYINPSGNGIFKLLPFAVENMAEMFWKVAYFCMELLVH